MGIGKGVDWEEMRDGRTCMKESDLAGQLLSSADKDLKVCENMTVRASSPMRSSAISPYRR
jgi:hypothetical protein